MIGIAQKEHRVVIYLSAALINTSSERVDLVSLKRAIISQLAAVFNCSVGRYKLSIHTDIEILYQEKRCSPAHVLFQVVDHIPRNNPAEADFRGLRIKLNKAVINDMIYQRNIRTIPHELGHLFGWDHPHARATYESVNPEAHELEKQLTEQERRHNLMSQSWYAQKSGIPLQQAMHITEKQVELLLLNYRSQALNKNFHLRRHLVFWWRILN